MAQSVDLLDHLHRVYVHLLPLISGVSNKYPLTCLCNGLTHPYLYSFVRNCVPQISDINIATSVSITFFAFSIFDILLLAFFYEIVAYGMATAIKWMRIISIVYGLTIVILAVLSIALESKDMDTIGEEVWAALSTNQKEFFDNDVSKL